MKKKISKIPKFKSTDEEVRFWDTHSIADYWDEFHDVNIKVDLDKPRSDTLIVRIQKDVKDKMSKIAKSKGLNISTLARMWMIEKINTL